MFLEIDKLSRLRGDFFEFMDEICIYAYIYPYSCKVDW